jgi:uncharacterized membrane protein
MSEVPPSRKKLIGVLLLIVGFVLISVGTIISGVGVWNWENGIMISNGGVTISKGEMNPFPLDMSKPFDIIIGNHAIDYWCPPQSLEEGFDISHIISMGGYPGTDFSIRIEQGKLLVSATLKNANNDTIAEIDNNIWRIRDPSSVWDMNYNTYAFEIVDENETPIFQVMMVGPNKIQIGVLLSYNEYGANYLIPLESGGAVINPSSGTGSVKASRIFEYPTTDPENLGKMVNPPFSLIDLLSEPLYTIIIGIGLFVIGSILVYFGDKKYKSSND